MENVNKFIASQSKLQLAEHAIVTVSLLYALKKIFGGKGIVKNIIQAGISTVKALPGGEGLLNNTLDEQAKKEADGFKGKAVEDPIVAIPKQAMEKTAIFERLQRMKSRDINPSEGKAFAYVYDASEEHFNLILEAHNMFIHTNMLNPSIFSSVRYLEIETAKMAGAMLNCPTAAGNVSSCGTESIFLTLSTYKNRAKALGYSKPYQVVAPKTIHPAFNKAAHYLDLEMVLVDIDPVTLAADVKAMEKAITKHTILIAASAPQYPHGVIDPIEDLGALAEKKKLPFHVDACIGGFILPWVEKLGYKIPKFDFRVKGVTSMTADLHKYGYSFKYASTVLYRDARLRKYQYYAYTSWPGGLYISPTTLGSRGGGPIAAAWTALVGLGEEGFMKLAKQCMDTADYLKAEIATIPELKVFGNSMATILAFGSKEGTNFNIYALADAMEEKGWKIEKQANPACIHCTIMPQHYKIKEKFMADIKQAMEEVKQNPAKYDNKGTSAVYGMVAAIPDNVVLEDFLTSFLNHVYS